jgi:Histidine phosphatase superfamily (branch 2)
MDSARIASAKREVTMPSNFKNNEMAPVPSPPSATTHSRRVTPPKGIFLVIFSCILVYCTYRVLFHDIYLLVLAGRPPVAYLWENAFPVSGESATVPQYFQTSPELWAGPTATGRAPFLAQTNPISFAPTATYVPNTPLETAVPIVGNTQNQSIFHLMGQLSPYFPNPIGFGVQEFPLPPGANIAQVQVRSTKTRYGSKRLMTPQMLSRHGSRYPTTGSNVEDFGRRIANATGTFEATGKLAFLNTWKYELGAEILVPRGRQELFESGILHYYNYGRLYNPNSKIIARTTTQVSRVWHLREGQQIVNINA